MDQQVSASNIPYEVARDGTPLLDAISVDHGNRHALGRFFLHVEATAHAAGVTVRLNERLDSFVETSRPMQELRGSIPPLLDPAQSSIERGFWLSAHNKAGEIVATHAGRLLTMTDTTLKDEIEGLRLHYADPAPHLAKGTTCVFSGEAARAAAAITGRASYVGGVWCRPDYRGRGLVYVLSPAVRYLALTRWDTDYTFAFFRSDLRGLGVLHKYGRFGFEQGLRLAHSYTGDVDLHFAWMGRKTMDEELRGYATLLGR